jgi:HK97 family phage prohead protease
MPETQQAEGRVFRSGFQLRDAAASSSINGRYSWLEGRAVPYGEPANIGWFLETFAPGSLAKSITEAARGLPLLAFHQEDRIDSLIGTSESWSDTPTGLDGVWKLHDADAAQRVAAYAAAGVLGYMSIRFLPIRSVWETNPDWDPDRGPEYLDSVTRVEARLLETSLVSTPAYQSAAISKVRTAERPMSPEASGRQRAAWVAWLETQKRAS